MSSLTTLFVVGPDEYVEFNESMGSKAFLEHVWDESARPLSAQETSASGTHLHSAGARISQTPPPRIEFPTVLRVRGNQYMPTGRFISWDDLFLRNPLAISKPPSLDKFIARGAKVGHGEQVKPGSWLDDEANRAAMLRKAKEKANVNQDDDGWFGSTKERGSEKSLYAMSAEEQKQRAQEAAAAASASAAAAAAPVADSIVQASALVAVAGSSLTPTTSPERHRAPPSSDKASSQIEAMLARLRSARSGMGSSSNSSRWASDSAKVDPPETETTVKVERSKVMTSQAQTTPVPRDDGVPAESKEVQTASVPSSPAPRSPRMADKAVGASSDNFAPEENGRGKEKMAASTSAASLSQEGAPARTQKAPSWDDPAPPVTPAPAPRREKDRKRGKGRSRGTTLGEADKDGASHPAASTSNAGGSKGTSPEAHKVSPSRKNAEPVSPSWDDEPAAAQAQEATSPSSSKQVEPESSAGQAVGAADAPADEAGVEPSPEPVAAPASEPAEKHFDWADDDDDDSLPELPSDWGIVTPSKSSTSTSNSLAAQVQSQPLSPSHAQTQTQTQTQTPAMDARSVADLEESRPGKRGAKRGGKRRKEVEDRDSSGHGIKGQTTTPEGKGRGAGKAPMPGSLQAQAAYLGGRWKNAPVSPGGPRSASSQTSATPDQPPRNPLGLRIAGRASSSSPAPSPSSSAATAAIRGLPPHVPMGPRATRERERSNAGVELFGSSDANSSASAGGGGSHRSSRLNSVAASNGSSNHHHLNTQRERERERERGTHSRPRIAANAGGTFARLAAGIVKPPSSAAGSAPASSSASSIASGGGVRHGGGGGVGGGRNVDSNVAASKARINIKGAAAAAAAAAAATAGGGSGFGPTRG